MTITRIRVIDTETTGFEPENSAVCEIGWTDIVYWKDRWVPTVPQSRLVDPEMPMPPEACAIHHITDKMLQGAPTLPTTLSRWNILDPEIECFAAQNVSFDSKFIHIEDPQQWVCTYRCAIRLAPKAPKHSNQFMRYWLKLQLDPIYAEPPHRAGADSYVTAHVLARMLNKPNDLSELIKITKEPVVLPRFTFGKHAMEPLSSVPSSYLHWILDKRADMDPDVVSTAEHHLLSRGERRARTNGIEAIT